MFEEAATFGPAPNPNPDLPYGPNSKGEEEEEEEEEKEEKERAREAEEEGFFCRVCRERVKSLSEEKHNTSTLHIFNQQHRPADRKVRGSVRWMVVGDQLVGRPVGLPGAAAADQRRQQDARDRAFTSYFDEMFETKYTTGQSLRCIGSDWLRVTGCGCGLLFSSRTFSRVSGKPPSQNGLPSVVSCAFDGSRLPRPVHGRRLSIDRGSSRVGKLTSRVRSVRVGSGKGRSDPIRESLKSSSTNRPDLTVDSD